MSAERNATEIMDYSPWFSPSERAPQEDQNGANFNYVAPSSEVISVERTKPNFESMVFDQNPKKIDSV